MKRILVPMDFSQPSLAAFRFAVALAARARAELVVVHVIELPFLPETTFGVQPYAVDPELINDLERRSIEAFEQVKAKFADGTPVAFHAIHDNVVSGIKHFVKQNQIDLIVMSTQGASGLDEFFIGSTAEKIARFSSVPVIAVPKETDLATIRNIVFPNKLELDQDDLIERLKEFQQLLTAKLHIVLINTPINFYTDEQGRKMLERFAKHYALNDFTLNFRNHQFERAGVLAFADEINGDMIAMATHGRTGLAHFFQGSIAESVLNRVEQPIWTYKLRK
ncbi:MAG TPA: universal stress protein [Chryseosolibacter sp.]